MFEWLNKKVLDHLRSKGAVGSQLTLIATEAGVLVHGPQVSEAGKAGEHLIPWAEVSRIAVGTAAGYGHDHTVLVIEAKSHTPLIYVEDMPGWREFAASIEEYLKGATPYAEWAVSSVAQRSETPLAIYDVSAAG